MSPHLSKPSGRVFWFLHRKARCLDQGIIRSFKAAYRRNPPTIDILRAIHFISMVWVELPQKVIYNCWQQAGIHSQLEKSSPDRKSYNEYIQYIQSGTYISINSLLDINCHSGQVQDMVDEFLFHDEELFSLLLQLSHILKAYQSQVFHIQLVASHWKSQILFHISRL
ncbi:hypothetical protein BDZ91DRAFT_522982 [Kalaharituber pfeilii]|nr:hypothetical protein BDZ91DRAFT_522982 [Kalaharituber pfeilii]